MLQELDVKRERVVKQMKNKYQEEKEKTITELKQDHSKHAEKRNVAIEKVVSKAHQELSKVEKAKARKQSFNKENAASVEAPAQGNTIPLGE